MASFLITYDLNTQGQNYKGLNDAIKSYDNWAKIATTTYIIKSSSNTGAIRDHLRKFIDDNDELIVAELTGVTSWYGLSKEVADWLLKNL
jgi:hypothetical protein